MRKIDGGQVIRYEAQQIGVRVGMKGITRIDEDEG
jgi:hypothetical protein